MGTPDKIRLNCPACDKRLQVGCDKSGKRIKCPACGEVMTVPSPSPAEPEAPPSPKDEKPKQPERVLECPCGATLHARRGEAFVTCTQCGETIPTQRAPSPNDGALLLFVNAKEDPQIIDFLTWGFFDGVTAWRARVGGEYAQLIAGGMFAKDQIVFLNVTKSLVLRKHEFAIDDIGQASKLWFGAAVTKGGMTTKANITIQGNSMSGVLTPAALQRYQDWKDA